MYIVLHLITMKRRNVFLFGIFIIDHDIGIRKIQYHYVTYVKTYFQEEKKHNFYILDLCFSGFIF